MKSIKVRSAQRNYSVYVGKNLLQKTGALIRGMRVRERNPRPARSKLMIVSQRRIAKHHLPLLYRSLSREGFKIAIHLLPDGEKAKSQKELFRLYRALISNDFERWDTVLALGGGVVGDLAAFGASTYLRGIPFVNVGTTLLAQVDSAIGGKTGINLEEGKNLVGTFYPPQLVVSDVGVLATLPMREFVASMAEVVKYGIIFDAALFRLLEKRRQEIIRRDPKILLPMVVACSRIKALIVSRDEHEVRGERMILNYGHTFAHAFEQNLAYRRLMHGEAVSIGMICAARLAVILGIFSGEEELKQLRLLSNLGLPVSLSKYRLGVSSVIHAMMRDKKKRAGDLRFVLPERIGRVFVREDVPLSLVRKVLLSLGCASEDRQD